MIGWLKYPIIFRSVHAWIICFSQMNCPPRCKNIKPSLFVNICRQHPSPSKGKTLAFNLHTPQLSPSPPKSQVMQRVVQSVYSIPSQRIQDASRDEDKAKHAPDIHSFKPTRDSTFDQSSRVCAWSGVIPSRHHIAQNTRGTYFCQIPRIFVAQSLKSLIHFSWIHSYSAHKRKKSWAGW